MRCELLKSGEYVHNSFFSMAKNEAVMDLATEKGREEVRKKIAALHREATTHKGVNWDKAVKCLQEAAWLMRKSDSVQTAAYWTRLPVFLQQAGRFDEAMQEFEQLLVEVKPRIKREASHCTPTAIRYFCHVTFAAIYDKMRMVCKRQKLPEKVKEYQHIYDQHILICDELSKIVDMERREMLDKWKQEKFK